MDVALYYRDLLSQPMRELCGMILNIRLGDFVPDGTCSGWMAKKQVALFEPRFPEREDTDVI